MCNSSDFSWFFSFDWINCFEFHSTEKIYNDGNYGKLHLDLSAGLMDEGVFDSNPVIGFQLLVFNKSENRRISSARLSVPTDAG